MIRNTLVLSRNTSSLIKNSSALTKTRSNFRQFASKPKYPINKETTPIYRDEKNLPVVFDMPRPSYIPSEELNPVEELNVASTEGIAPSGLKEKLPQMSEEDIKILTHYAAKEKKIGILEPFEQTYNKLTSFIQTRVFQGLRTLRADYFPIVSPYALVFPTASIIGKVELYNDTSIWYNCILRADTNAIKIGKDTNIQDGTVIIPSSSPLGFDHDGSTIVGHRVTVGHNCTLHACTIEDRCLIGMGSTLENDSYMETMSQLGAGSVLKSGTRVKSGQLWVGNPARYVRDLTGNEIVAIDKSAQYYSGLAREHLKEFPEVQGVQNPVTQYHLNV